MTRYIEANAGDVAWFVENFNNLVTNVEICIKGKTTVIRTAAICLIADGHMLLEDVPGTGKTTLAKALVASIDGDCQRVQCTPDLLPSDITGLSVFNPGTMTFDYKPGPVNTNLLLCDEINRASPKTQSALLEVMEERRVTVDGASICMPEPFVVMATQNPIEHAGTYRLPEAQVDRFMMQLSVGRPSPEAAVEILTNKLLGQRPEDLRPVMTTADLRRMTAIANSIYVKDEIRAYIVELQEGTHTLPGVRLGASLRGSIALQAVSQALAASSGRTYVTADDVKALATAVLAHRLLLEPDAELRGQSSVAMIKKLLADVPVRAPYQSAGV
jgi:MoxR-like ATPase